MLRISEIISGDTSRFACERYQLLCCATEVYLRQLYPIGAAYRHARGVLPDRGSSAG